MTSVPYKINPLLSFCVLLLILCLNSCPKVFAGTDDLDWLQIARLKPNLKVITILEGNRQIELKDLAALADQGFVPADRDPGSVMGLKQAVFSTTLRHWVSPSQLVKGFNARLLSKFFMSGIYRVGFAIAEKEYRGPLTLRVTAPRESFGLKLIYSDHVVRPKCQNFISVDEAGNRWLEAYFPEIKEKDTIKFHFAFKYEVNMEDLLRHDLVLSRKPLEIDINPDARRFRLPGYKIDPHKAEALNWAAQGPQGPPDACLEYKRLTDTLSKLVRYDKPKREAYFTGKAVYSDLDHMYQDVDLTLRNGKGCCPDTVLVECSFLRARGIPCRTAGRVGHFFSEVYVPGRGWMSTSVTPTGIPLIVSPGPDHVPYQNWTPTISLQTTHWEAGIRIQELEETR